MASKIRHFPDMLFPNSSTKWKGLTVVDYGVNDVFDIDVEDGKINCDSRRNVGRVDDDHDKYKPVGTCLPLTKPNSVGNLPVTEEIRDFSICQHEYNVHYIGREVKTNNRAQLNRLFIDHPELLLGTILDEMNQDQLDLLLRNFHPLKYACDVPILYSKRLYPPGDSRRFFNERSQAQKLALLRFSNKRPLESRMFVKKLDSLLDTIFEIPSSILLDYLDEGLIMKYDELIDNYHIGNHLAHYKNYLIHPEGSFESVCITPLIATKDEHKTVMIYDSENTQRISTNGTLQEITCLGFDDQTSLMGIRSDYCCSFLSNSTENVKNDGKYFDVVDEINVKSRVLAMSINPYFANEAMVLLEDGSLKCWTDGQLNYVGDNDMINYCAENDICWINCIYGSNPRSLLFIHSEEASIYDMRVPKRPCQLLLPLPNQFLNRMDKLARPASLHPTNPHNIMLTTEQGLVIIDERFMKSPLLTMNHYMRSSPQFMQTVTDDVDSAIRTLAFLGGHRYQDTRCLEFEQRLIKRTTPFNETGGEGFITQPPVCTRMPWKLAAPDSWLRNITNDSRITSPGVAKRLKQPLVGLSIFQMEASLSKDLVAIQLTKAGDLFYQLLAAGNNTALVYDNGHGVTGSRNSSCDDDSSTSVNRNLIGDNETHVLHHTQKKCADWVACAYEMYNKYSLVNEKANLCPWEITTDRGNITKVFESQDESRSLFKRSQSKDATLNEKSSCLGKEGNQGSGSALSGCKGDHQDMGDSINSGIRNNVTQCNELKKSKEIIDSDDNLDEQCSQSKLENIEKFCCICGRPWEEDGGQCNGCNLGTEVSSNLRLAYEKGCFLNNKLLGQNSEQPILRFVRHPERSRDPLSTVLLANWDNDDVYTPLDLSQHSNERSHVVGNENGPLVENMMKWEREEHFEEQLGRCEDPDESSDGWYLNASGRLEFDPVTPQVKNEEVLGPGPMTRSRRRVLSRSTEKRKSRTAKRDELLAKYPRSATYSKEKSIAKNVEKSEETDVNKLEITSSKELISSPQITRPSSRNVVRNIFSSEKDNVKTVTVDGLANENMPSNSTSIATPLKCSSLGERRHCEGDSSFRFDVQSGVDQEINSRFTTVQEDLSNYDFVSIDTTVKIHSPSPLKRTPKKKKLSREMGF